MAAGWRWGVTGLVLAAATAFIVLVPVASATFTGRTTNAANSWTAGAWQSAGSVTFSDTGSVETFTVPTGRHWVTVKAWGAQGSGSGGGPGGYAEAVVPVTPGEVLQVNVGRRPSGQSGGWGGGGRGGDAAEGPLGVGSVAAGGGGGGSSEVRRGTTELVVAGGGGGGSDSAGQPGGDNPSSAVRVSGQDGAPGSTGLLGVGACTGGGGGGGGYFGGAGGGCGSGGSGGSSYVGAFGNISTQTRIGERVNHGHVVISWG